MFQLCAILSVTRAPKPLCENYIIKWTRQGMARDIDQLNNFKVGDIQLSVDQYLSQDFIGVELRHQKVDEELCKNLSCLPPHSLLSRTIYA